MSRLGKKPVAIPAGVTVLAQPGEMTVKGPKGELKQSMKPGISVAIEGEQAVVSRENDSRKSRELHGLYRSLLSNMVEGVTNGYEKRLRIVGTGYRVELKGDVLVIHAGYCHPVEFKIPAGIEIEVPKSTSREYMDWIVRGCDKQKVGEVAISMRRVRPPDLYKGKGIRFADENVRKLEGKSFGS